MIIAQSRSSRRRRFVGSIEIDRESFDPRENSDRRSRVLCRLPFAESRDGNPFAKPILSGAFFPRPEVDRKIQSEGSSGKSAANVRA